MVSKSSASEERPSEAFDVDTHSDIVAVVQLANTLLSGTGTDEAETLLYFRGYLPVVSNGSGNIK